MPNRTLAPPMPYPIAIVDLTTPRGWAYAQTHLLNAHPTVPLARIVFADSGIRVVACDFPGCAERWIDPVRGPAEPPNEE